MDLRAELLRRRDLDQEPMRKMVGRVVDQDQRDRLDATIRENTEWLRGVIREQGWPRRSQVGEEGADAAWLLAQHADHDPAFQRECLNLLEMAVAEGEAGKRNLAHLTDRVSVAERGTQVYGTQLTGGKGGLSPPPIEDPEGVNQRRSEMGLGSLGAYQKLMLPVMVLAGARVLATLAWRRVGTIASILRRPRPR